MSEQLKPCPFCGGEAVMLKFGANKYSVECVKCGEKVYTTRDEAIAAWNARVDK